MTLPAEWMPCLRLAGLLGAESGLIIAVAFALERRIPSPLWHRAIWHSATVSILLLLSAETTGLSRDLSAWARQWVGPAQPFTAQATPLPVGKEVPHAEVLKPGGLTDAFRDRVARRLVQNQEYQAGERERSNGGGSPSAEFMVGSSSASLEPAETFLQGRTLPWPELIWFIGLIAVLGPIFLARLVFFVFRQKRSEIADPDLLKRAESIAVRLGMRRPVRLFESETLGGPVAFGLLRPRIGLPKGFCGTFSVPQQEAILAHELAHLAGHDPGWQWLTDLMAALLWWNPLVWWARHRGRVAAEAAADQASLVVSDGPGLLAECLLQLASRTAGTRSLHWLGATGTGFRSGLGQRIERLVRLSGASWAPLSRVYVSVVKLAVPAVLVAATILCTAWAAPRNSGGPMNTIRQTWKRSVATLALFAAFGAEQGHAQTTPSAARPAQAAELPAAQPGHSGSLPLLNQATLIEDARLLIEMGKLDEAEAKANEALRVAPGNKKAARILKQIHDLRAQTTAGEAQAAGAPATAVESVPPEAPATPPAMDRRLMERYGLAAPGRQPAATPAAPAAAAEPDSDQAEQERRASMMRMDPRLLARYGLLKTGTGATGSPAPGVPFELSRGKQQIETKLNQILLNEVLYDGLPLSEVVRDLNEQARKRDPDKRGINFLISNVFEGPVTSGGIDPTTGQPLPASPSTVDLSSVIIHLHLREVRLKDVLDAMVKINEVPLKYSVEDYGVVFSPASNQMPSRQPSLAGEQLRLQVRTFKVDTNTFLAGLESAFGISVPRGASGAATSGENLPEGKVANKEANPNRPSSAREIQQALRQLLQQLGIQMDLPAKAVFYNDLTGIVMVRATPDDLELVQAAVETLGGSLLTQKAASISGDTGAPGPNELMRARYGLPSRYGGGYGAGTPGQR